MTQKSNSILINLVNNNCSSEFAEEVVDFLINCPNIKEAFINRLFVKPDPKDIFILALTELRDTGDIDCLVRALNWQQNTIDSLRCDVDNYHKTLLKLDVLRQECSRLQHNLSVVRDRNAQLIKALKEHYCPIPKSKNHEIKKKNPRSNR